MVEIRPKWETVLLTFKHNGRRPCITVVVAQNDYFDVGFYQEVIDHPRLRWLRWFGITYEKRVRNAIKKCEEWCERENRL